MDGDRSFCRWESAARNYSSVFRNADLVGDVEEFCAPPPAVDDDALDELPCSAGHTACYISPYGDVFPCVQFPLPTRQRSAAEISGYLAGLAAAERSALDSWRDLPVCSTCSHVGYLHALSGFGLYGRQHARPLIQDCEKSFARTGFSPPT